MMPENNGSTGITGGLPVVQYTREVNGGYRRISSADTGIVDVVNRQAWQALDAEINAARLQVETGRVSPIHYYMMVNQMDPGLLGRYMGISAWRVRWHLRPMGFRCLRPALLRRYAELFQVTEQDLREGVLRAAIYEQRRHLGGGAAPGQLSKKGGGGSGA